MGLVVILYTRDQEVRGKRVKSPYQALALHFGGTLSPSPRFIFILFEIGCHVSQIGLDPSQVAEDYLDSLPLNFSNYRLNPP